MNSSQPTLTRGMNEEADVTGVMRGDGDDAVSLGLELLSPEDYMGSSPSRKNNPSRGTCPVSRPNESGGTLSKLEILRARNNRVRQQSYMQLDRSRRSLEYSSSILLSPMEKGTLSSLSGSDIPNLDETSIGSSWEHDCWSPDSVQSRKRGDPPQILLLSPMDDPLAKKTVAIDVSSMGYMDQCKRLQDENETIRRHLSLLQKRQEAMVQRDRVMNRRVTPNYMASLMRKLLHLALIFVFLFLFIQSVVPSGHTLVLFQRFTLPAAGVSTTGQDPTDSVPTTEALNDSMDNVRTTEAFTDSTDIAPTTEAFTDLTDDVLTTESLPDPKDDVPTPSVTDTRRSRPKHYLRQTPSDLLSSAQRKNILEAIRLFAVNTRKRMNVLNRNDR